MLDTQSRFYFAVLPHSYLRCVVCWKRYPGDVVVSSHVEYYETSSGVFARNTAKHQKRWQDAADSSSAEGVSETHGGTLVSLFDAAVSLLAARRRSHKHGCDASGART